MVTFLAGGTGTPKLLAGARERLSASDITVVANTGDDVELGGLMVCPDIDTVLFEGADILDRETWWGIADDTGLTHDYLAELSDRVDIASEPRYLDGDQQTEGRSLARWRRFSGAGEFMYIGDRDRAVHLLRTGLLDEGHTLTEVTKTLADAFDLPYPVVPMSDDPIATIVHTLDGPMHFQEFWVARGGDPTVTDVEFRGIERASAADAAIEALDAGPVVIGPSNPVTSIGPMLELPMFADRLTDRPVVAVSPFVDTEAFSGPAPKLMSAVGLEPSTLGVAAAYPFVDAFVLDSEDRSSLDRPTVRTDTRIESAADASRVMAAVSDALTRIGVRAS